MLKITTNLSIILQPVFVPGLKKPEYWSVVAAGKAAVPAGEGPAVSVARVGHEAISQFVRVIAHPLREVNGPAAPWLLNLSE